jgi:hypothetical protein
MCNKTIFFIFLHALLEREMVESYVKIMGQLYSVSVKFISTLSYNLCKHVKFNLTFSLNFISLSL